MSKVFTNQKDAFAEANRLKKDGKNAIVVSSEGFTKFTIKVLEEPKRSEKIK